MNNSILFTALRFLALLAVQVLILNNINLFGYVEPIIYVWFILLLPIRTPKWLVLILSFLIGFCVDIFLGQVGFHTAVSVFSGFIRPIFLSPLNANQQQESNNIPTSSNMGFLPYLGYVSVITFVHIFLLIAIESFRWAEILPMLMRIILSSVSSIFLIMICELMFFKSNKD